MALKRIPQGRTEDEQRAIIRARNHRYHAEHREAIRARKKRNADMRRLLPRAQVIALAKDEVEA